MPRYVRAVQSLCLNTLFAMFTATNISMGDNYIGAEKVETENNELTTEESTNFHFQLGWSISKLFHLLFDIGLFYNQLDDLIATDVDPVQSTQTGLQISNH